MAYGFIRIELILQRDSQSLVRLSAAGAPLKSLKCEIAAHGPEEGRTGFAVTVDRFTNRSGQPNP